MTRGNKRTDPIDQVLAGAEVLADAYDDFDERAALDRIARRVVWHRAVSMEHRARSIRTESGAGTQPTDAHDGLPAALHEQAADELGVLSSHVVRDPAAIAAMALLVDDRATIEPTGALAFACLLYLADRHDAARFWWQFAAGADSPTAAHCLFLHHLQHSELRDAQHWRTQAHLPRQIGQDPLANTSWSPGTDQALTHRLWSPARTEGASTTVTVDLVHRTRRPATSPPLSNSIAKAVQRLEQHSDEDFGTIPKPDPELAAELEDCAASR
ncbi:hypothetical protein ACFWVC_21245 [Streptomyces sp. NPDC058691]|uniref:hypothetical protein n=1 Tax=Streptomyces sp. NPDC058691 TaxID=3346601 RepID=UPI0036665306